MMQLLGYLKRGGVQYPLSTEVVSSVSNVHDGATVHEPSSSYKFDDAYEVRGVPNYLPQYSNLPSNVSEDREAEFPSYIRNCFHTGSM